MGRYMTVFEAVLHRKFLNLVPMTEHGYFQPCSAICSQFSLHFLAKTSPFLSQITSFLPFLLRFQAFSLLTLVFTVYYFWSILSHSLSSAPKVRISILNLHFNVSHIILCMNLDSLLLLYVV